MTINYNFGQELFHYYEVGDTVAERAWYGVRLKKKEEDEATNK